MSKKVKFSLIFITFLLIVSIIGFWQAKKITANFEKPQTNTNQESEKIKIKDMLITETKDGQKYWEVFASLGEYTNTKNKATLTDVVGNFYKEGKVSVSFKADAGMYESDIKRITLNSKALIIAEDGTSLSADKIVWEGSTDKIKAFGHVQIIKDDSLYATCDRSEFTSDFQKFKTFDNTTTKVYSK